MNVKKILSYGMISVIAMAFQVIEPARAFAQEPSKIEYKLYSINPLCRREIKIASGQIKKIIDEYSIAVRNMNDKYITWRSSSNPESDLEGRRAFDNAQSNVRYLESALEKNIETMNRCKKPGHKH